MTPILAVQRRLVRAVEYRGLAAKASELALTSGLAQVRERHEAAAARWNDLAALDERAGESHPVPGAPLAKAAHPTA